ncbi:collagen-like protein [Bradyrhizobium septentrionale]|uniref:collagen-like protein n=1 Tax=Bradyrhizobium septentrionale TaxID=1404411 RepID=UPI0030D128A7
MQSNGKSETSLPVPTGSDAADFLLEAWREALADVLDKQREQWQRERQLIEAQSEAAILKLRGEVIELRQLVMTYAREQLTALQQQVSDRLAELKDGADGRDGDPGLQGLQGLQGERGERGDTGERGEIGPMGERGERGEQGPQGERGDNGERGQDGKQGEKGEAGEQGQPGPAGDQGVPGEKGETGERGEKGEAGEQGQPGPAGDQGVPGEKGETGERGEKGEAGEQGQSGPAGDQGVPGEKGETGERGEAGPPGEKGAPGQLKTARAYEDGSVHYDGDLVLHQGSTYQARCDTAKAPPHEDWQLIAAKGRDAVMPKILGTYREGENYSFLNIVALGGSSFIARSDDPGPCPGEGWQLIASAGRPGKQGPPGARGEAGARGERGLPAPSIIGWTIDREAYTATPILSDTSEAAPLQLRELFVQFQDEAS